MSDLLLASMKGVKIVFLHLHCIASYFKSLMTEFNSCPQMSMVSASEMICSFFSTGNKSNHIYAADMYGGQRDEYSLKDHFYQ